MDTTSKSRARNVSLSKAPSFRHDDDADYITIKSVDFFTDSANTSGTNSMSSALTNALEAAENDPLYKEKLMRKHRGRRTLYLAYCIILTGIQMGLAFWSIFMLVELILQKRIWSDFAIFLNSLFAIPVQWLAIMIAISEITGRMLWALPHIVRKHACPGSVWMLTLTLLIGVLWNCMLSFAMHQEDSCVKENEVMWLIWCYRIFVARGVSYVFCTLILFVLGCCMCSVLIWIMVWVVSLLLGACVRRRNAERKYELLATSIDD